MRADVSPKLQSSKSGEPPKLDIFYYTDPDCSWSWALEPEIKKITEEYAGQARITYKMCGFQDKWADFFDTINNVGHPEHVAPHWAAVAKRSGMPLDWRIWFEDPPTSSYPGCIAYKAAVLQDEKKAQNYLRKLREAVLTERRNIARQNILFSIAEETALDIDRFREDYLTGPAQGAFNEDLEESRGRGITSSPTIVVRNLMGQEKMLIGYRPYREYEKAIETLAATPLLKMPLLPIGDFVRKSQCVATEEVARVYEIPTNKALIELEKLCAGGQVVKTEKAGGEFWRPLLIP